MKKFSSAFLVLVSVFLLLPLVMTLVYSLFQEWTRLTPTGFSLKSYILLFGDKLFLLSLGRTLVISIVPILLATLMVLLAIFVTVVYLPWLDKYIQMVCMMPYTLQGIILATSILSLYGNSSGFLSNRVFLLTAAYCIIILPFIYQGIRNSLRAVSAESLIEAAQMLGCTRFKAFFQIIVPNILSGITVSSMLSMSIVFGDFALVNILAGSHYTTTQIYLQKKMAQSGQISSAVIVVLFVITLMISLAVFLIRKKDSKAHVTDLES